MLCDYVFVSFAFHSETISGLCGKEGHTGFVEKLENPRSKVLTTLFRKRNFKVLFLLEF